MTVIPASTRAANDRSLLGVGLMLAFCVTAPLIDVAAKLASDTIPVGQITTARFLFQAILMLPVLLLTGHGLRLAWSLVPLVALRGALLMAATFTFVSAIAVMPIADALAILFVEPFILLLLGFFLFGEKVGPRRIMASVVGFGGALLVIQPSLATFGFVALWPLATAFSFAFYMIVTRSLSTRVHPIPMQFHTATLAFAVCVPLLALGQRLEIPVLTVVRPVSWDWVLLVAVGGASALSHLFITYALRFATSATLAPLHYLEIVSAAILGYLVFGDFPDPLKWAGIAIIIASGLYIIHRERLASQRGRA